MGVGEGAKTPAPAAAAVGSKCSFLLVGGAALLKTACMCQQGGPHLFSLAQVSVSLLSGYGPSIPGTVWPAAGSFRKGQHCCSFVSRLAAGLVEPTRAKPGVAPFKPDRRALHVLGPASHSQSLSHSSSNSLGGGIRQHTTKCCLSGSSPLSPDTTHSTASYSIQSSQGSEGVSGAPVTNTPSRGLSATHICPACSVCAATRWPGAGCCLLVFMCAEAAGVTRQGEVRANTGADTQQ
jgi:hypothetical protein